VVDAAAQLQEMNVEHLWFGSLTMGHVLGIPACSIAAGHLLARAAGCLLQLLLRPQPCPGVLLILHNELIDSYILYIQTYGLCYLFRVCPGDSASYPLDEARLKLLSTW
jgi:hypothetical protein